MKARILLAAGLITGEALLGISLAVPIVANKGVNPLQIKLPGGPAAWPGVILLVAVLTTLFVVSRRSERNEGPPPFIET